MRYGYADPVGGEDAKAKSRSSSASCCAKNNRDLYRQEPPLKIECISKTGLKTRHA
jgi:hypothetical protein